MLSILAVDDSASMRQMVSFTLKNAGFQVTEAVDGQDAWEKAGRQDFDLVLTDACDTLMEGFLGVSTQLQSMQVVKPANSAAIERAVAHLGKTAKALQFQDMSTQLIAHASQRLRHCCDRLAQDVFADDEDGDAVIEPAPLRPNPVTQSEVDTGFVELF